MHSFGSQCHSSTSSLLHLEVASTVQCTTPKTKGKRKTQRKVRAHTSKYSNSVARTKRNELVESIGVMGMGALSF